MKKTLAAFLTFILFMPAAVWAEQSAGNGPAAQTGAALDFDALLSGMADAVEMQKRVDADLAALDGELAADITVHWKRVYWDPSLRLYLYGRDDPALLPIKGKHAFVVLGFQLQNGQMAPELKARCDAAAAAARAFPSSILVCSGGATGANNPARHTESGLMKDYLVRVKGVAASRVFIDEKALTTVENALNTFAILREQGVEEITLVTSSYHQRRALTLYYALAAFMQQNGGPAIELVGNFSNEMETTKAQAATEAYFTVYQLDELLRMLSMSAADTE